MEYRHKFDKLTDLELNKAVLFYETNEKNEFQILKNSVAQDDVSVIACMTLAPGGVVSVGVARDYCNNGTDLMTLITKYHIGLTPPEDVCGGERWGAYLPSNKHFAYSCVSPYRAVVISYLIMMSKQRENPFLI
jgi:Protein of unknown function (DUF2591).